MRRRIAIDYLNDILDGIHNDVEDIEALVEEFQKIVVPCDIQLEKDEIREERATEYIKLFKMTGISEHDVFKDRNDFYRILLKQLDK